MKYISFLIRYIGGGLKQPGKGNGMNMKKIAIKWILICLSAVLLCVPAFAETAGGAADLANTEWPEGFLDACTLPDGGLVLAGYTDFPAEEGKEIGTGRILCLNPDRTVRWEITDTDVFGYGSVCVTPDNTIAAWFFNGVKFFTMDGHPAGKEVALIYTGGEVYDIIPRGIIGARRTDGTQADSLSVMDWDKNVLFRISEPESMWVGLGPIAEEDGLVLFGREAGNPAEAALKIMKVDYQGRKLWETSLPALMEKKETAAVRSCIRTKDGGYLASLLEYTDDYKTSECALAMLSADGRILWMKDLDIMFLDAAEYDGKFVVSGAGTDMMALKYLWLDADGNELGTTELAVRDEDYPPFTDRRNVRISAEMLLPMNDGLWQLLSFLETDEPEEEAPAWSPQDNILLPVPSV